METLLNHHHDSHTTIYFTNSSEEDKQEHEHTTLIYYPLKDFLLTNIGNEKKKYFFLPPQLLERLQAAHFEKDSESRCGSSPTPWMSSEVLSKRTSEDVTWAGIYPPSLEKRRDTGFTCSPPSSLSPTPSPPNNYSFSFP